MAGMAVRPEPAGVGARLKQTRESKRIALRQIANATKLSVSALEAIERNDIGKLPGGLFARSFVRAYASELGLDVEQTVRDYFAQFPDLGDAPPVAVYVEPEEASHNPAAAAALKAAAIGVPIVALIAWVVFGWVTGSRRPPTLASERVPAAQLPMAAPRPLPDVVPAVGTAPAREAIDAAPGAAAALTLHITARKECWVSVTADGRDVVSRLLGVGEEEAVRASSEFRIKIGDASAVTMRLNGALVRSLGRPGEVVTLRIDQAAVPDLLETH
jgi:cytoskeletal protein RodZ